MPEDLLSQVGLSDKVRIIFFILLSLFVWIIGLFVWKFIIYLAI